MGSFGEPFGGMSTLRVAPVGTFFRREGPLTEDVRRRLNDELRSLTGVIVFDDRCKFCRRVVKRSVTIDQGARLRLCSARSNRLRALATALGRRPEDTFAFNTGSKTYLDMLAYGAILLLTPQSRPFAWFIARSPAAISGNLPLGRVAPAIPFGAAGARRARSDRQKLVYCRR